MFGLPPRDRPVCYVPVLDWCVCSETSRLFQFPSQSALSYSPGPVLCGFEADQAHVWRTEILGVLVFAPVPIGSAAGDGVSV